MHDAGTELSALADPTRRTIFEMVRERPRAVGEIARELPVSRPAVSQHLRVLLEAGLVSADQVGARRLYAVAPGGLSGLRSWLENQWEAVLDAFESAARRERETWMTANQQIDPIVKQRTLPFDPGEAFRSFTERIGSWWPTATHSIEGDRDADIRFEGRVGGRVVEIAADGTEWAWADVLAWNPPHRVVLSWHPNEEPVAASTIEVTFTAVDEGTQVRLEHRGWEEFGAAGWELRDQYATGWEPVLDAYMTATG